MIPVLIVGGGPVGLALALDLGWRGVPCTLVEQGDGEIVDAKMFATGIRTVEFCRRWGIAEQVKELGLPARLSVRQRVRHQPHRPRDRPHPDAVDRADEAVRLQPRAVRALSAIRLRSDPGARGALPSVGHACAIAARSTAFREEARLRRRRPARRRDRQARAGSRALPGGMRRLLVIGAQGARHRDARRAVHQPLGQRDAAHARPRRHPSEGQCRALRAGRAGRSVGEPDAGRRPRALAADDPWRGSRRAAGGRCRGRSAPRRRPRLRLRDPLGRPLGAPPHGGGSLSEGPRVPCRRRRACDAAEWRARHEHRRRRRRRSRLEARRDALTAGAARICPTATRPSAARSASASATRRCATSSAMAAAGRCRRSSTRRRKAMRRAPSSASGSPRGNRMAWENPLHTHLGYRYDGSPLCVPDGPRRRRNPKMRATIASRAIRAARAPHAWLADGRSTLDLFGRGFTLLRFGRCAGRRRARRRRRAARRATATSSPLDEPDIGALYERKLVLVRPDGHVAWRGDAPAGRAAP